MAKDDDYDFQPLLDAAQNQLAFTLSDSDSSDTKALAIIGFDLAIGIFTLQSEAQSSLWLLVPLFVCLAISIVVSLFINIPLGYIGAIVDLEKHPEYLEMNKEDVILQLLADTQAAIAYNTKQNKRKSRLCLIAIATSFFATVLIACCII